MSTLKIKDLDGDLLEVEPMASFRDRNVLACVTAETAHGESVAAFITRKDAKKLRRYLKSLLRDTPARA